MHALFRPIADLFRKPTPTGRAGNLTEAQFQALKRLSISDDYRIWQSVLDQRVMLQAEQLLAAGDAFRLAQLQGTLVGMRLAGSLVDEALQYEAHAENERSRPKPSNERRPEHARATLYGTPAGSTVFSR
jgi:hypothetical protein